MRTTKLTELTKLPTIKNIETIESNDMQGALKWFNNRLTKLLENPLSEFGAKALNVLDMKNTTKQEEESMQLGQMFWHSLHKMWEMVQKDRQNEQIQNMFEKYWTNKQIERMLRPFWLHLSWTSDDYTLAKAA